ncbi:HAD family hydrolase [Actinomycetota bacterium Odt1-20B]
MAFFDLDNTLIDRQGALESYAAEFCRARELGASAEREMLTLLGARAYPKDFEALRQRWGLAESASALWESYVDGVSTRVTCLPGVTAGLDRMRAGGWALAVVTNGAADIQRAKLEHVGLCEYFATVCVSEEVGVRKPDPRIFHATAERCGVDLTRHGWMVGDGAVTDIGGGAAVGLHTMWIALGRLWTTEGATPDRVADTTAAAISELLAESE